MARVSVRRLVSVGLASFTILAAVVASTTGARVGHATGVAQSSLVNAVPGDNSPNIKDGATYAIAKVGGKIIVGGSFGQAVNHGTSQPVYDRYRILAFDATTGKVDTDFDPALNQASNTVVNALEPGPDGHSVYVGGVFTTVNGTNRRNVALVDTNTGALVTSFSVPAPNGAVNVLRTAGSRLLLGGNFTKIGSTAHGGLASVSATSGALDPYLGVDVAGHHNWTATNGGAQAAVGVTDMDVSPDGGTLVAIGNFKTADGLARDQIVRIGLGGASATVADWATDAYTPPCSYKSFDSYVRGVGFAPDGSYFVVVATGGLGGLPATSTYCDAASRFDTADTGTSVQPAWTDRTGADTLFSVAVTGTAVYVGGHQRWLNNQNGKDSAGSGAVPRPGVGALDPRTGVPLAWNPGRNPRGVGAKALLATANGLYVGQDTDYIGNRKYFRGKIAFFPLAGGEQTPPENLGSLPGTLFTAHSDGAAYKRTYDGSHFGAKGTVSGAGSWASVRGGFMVNGKLYYGNTNGYMYSRTFNGTTFGTATKVDPYDDPTWSNVQTGSGQTYQGVVPSLYANLSDVTGMVYRDGRLYYVRGSTALLYYRDFSPESGVLGETVHHVSDMARWKTSGDMFLDGDDLYYTSRTTGNMYKTAWNDGQPDGPVTQVSGPGMDGFGWKNTILFLYAG